MLYAHVESLTIHIHIDIHIYHIYIHACIYIRWYEVRDEVIGTDLLAETYIHTYTHTHTSDGTRCVMRSLARTSSLMQELSKCLNQRVPQ
jgi:hypothetical protein